MAHQPNPSSSSGLSPSVAEKRILGLFSVRTADAHGPGTRHLYLSRHIPVILVEHRLVHFAFSRHPCLYQERSLSAAASRLRGKPSRQLRGDGQQPAYRNACRSTRPLMNLIERLQAVWAGTDPDLLQESEIDCAINAVAVEASGLRDPTCALQGTQVFSTDAEPGRYLSDAHQTAVHQRQGTYKGGSERRTIGFNLSAWRVSCSLPVAG